MITAQAVKAQALTIGFSKVGISTAQSGIEVERLKTWLEQGYHADMTWMNDPRRQNVQALMPEVQSVISLALNYYTPYQHDPSPDRAKISCYGWGRDYHKILGKMLKQLCHWLEQQGENILTHWCVDTAPITEKAWAERAGIGWIGKHSNLITREYGSWVFLGEVLTNSELEPDRPHTDHCGKCQLCIQACPTDAIVQPYVVDANRCIAYHTIENRSENIPDTIAPHLQNWVAGCDICQEVCPYNRRPVNSAIADFAPYPDNLSPLLTDLIGITDQQWDQQFRSSALRRIKPAQLRRNAKGAIAPEKCSPNKEQAQGCEFL